MRLRAARFSVAIAFAVSLPSGGAWAQGEPLVTAAERAARTPAQPGDRMTVKVRREPTLSDSLTVPADGRITLARLGSVDVTRFTIAELADTLRGRYGRFLRNPAVDIQVLRRVAVNGEVYKPNVYYVDVAMTLRDVIALAGGITPEGSSKRVEVVRRGERLAMPAWEDDFTLASDLTSGDQIVVGKRPWLSRNGLSAIGSAAVVASLLLSLRR